MTSFHRFLVLATIVWFNTEVIASQISPQSAGVSVSHLSNGHNVNLAAPNPHGISFNQFSQFKIDQPLNILNLQRNALGNPSIRTIVIAAPEITLSDTIRVLGPKVDVVFMATSGQFACTNCRIENVYRATLASATINSITASASTLGQFTATQSRQLSVSNLSAPGAISVDLLADTILLNGTNTTHQRVNPSSGGYINNANGRYSLGGGSFNLFMGEMVWDYETQQVKAFGEDATNATLAGVINSTAVNIVTSKTLSLNTHIDTRTDLVASNYYQGSVKAVDEAVMIERVYPKEADLEINGRIHSEGKVEITGSYDVFINAGAVIDGTSVQIIALSRGDVIHEGTIYGYSTSLAAGASIRNYSLIESETRLELYAGASPKVGIFKDVNGGVLNLNGGKLLADTIIIESRSRLVNGETGVDNIQTDIQYTEVENNTGEPDSGFGVVLPPGPNRHENRILMADGLKKIGYLAQYESFTKTINANDVVDSKIIAKNIKINVENFLNINPFYTTNIQADGEVVLDTNTLNQVMISAENQLEIQATSSIKNVSALMIVNSGSGGFKAECGNFQTYSNGVSFYTSCDIKNQRYIVVNELDTETSSTENTVTSKTTVYSPPARIVAMGNLEIKARKITNETSSIEVFDSAKVDVNTFRDIGVVHTKVGTVSEYTVVENNCLNDAYGYGTIPNCLFRETVLSNTENISVNANALNSLLFVQNTFNGPSVDFYGGDFSPLEDYVHDMAILAAPELFTGVGVYNVIDFDPDNNAITIEQNVVNTTTGTLTFESVTQSIYELAVEYYDYVVAKVNEFMAYLGL
ncbi:MAG: hypothetical protein AAGB12_16350 [Pseudomonadota bacterium]